jgi:hypothetical protein
VASGPSWPFAPYEVACGCGYLMRGFRQASHQVARCPDCGHEVFILPASPLPAVAPFVEPNAPLPVPFSRDKGHRRWVSGAVVITLVAVCLVLAIGILYYSAQDRVALAALQAGALKELRDQFAAGQGALNQGNFQSALEHLEEAQKIRKAHPRLLRAPESRDLTQVHQQAELLANLLTESLEEILRRLDGLDVHERSAVFARHYQHRAVVFFTTVRRDAAGRYLMDYRIFDGRQEARLELGELKLLQVLPLQDPQQLLFGFRVAEVRREPAGTWVIAAEPDSGVVFTNLGAAAACSFLPVDDLQLQEVVRRQAGWLAELP